MARRNLMHRRAASGQALVEMVLGIIVFVTVLIFGIHFAEVGALSVKVTEAQHSAVFDATGHPLHEWPKDASPANQAVSKATEEAQKRYQDFDSRSGGGGASLTQVFTRAENFKVTCQIGEGPSYAQGITTGAYGDNKGVNCTSTAQVSSTGIPTSFMDQGTGFFSVKHHVPITIGVCGFGRGDCTQRKLIMLLDDWGLSRDKGESKNCLLEMDSPGCENKPFWTMAESVYKAGGGGLGNAGSELVEGILGQSSPIDEQQFWMSASMTESEFKQTIDSEGLTEFTTTPHEAHYLEAYKGRKTCWLGRECP